MKADTLADIDAVLAQQPDLFANVLDGAFPHYDQPPVEAHLEASCGCPVVQVEVTRSGGTTSVCQMREHKLLEQRSDLPLISYGRSDRTRNYFDGLNGEEFPTFGDPDNSDYQLGLHCAELINWQP